jgi:transposase-like protein
MEVMMKHRSHSAAFKRLVAEAYRGGESAQEVSRRHGVSRNLVRIWVSKLDEGALGDDVVTAELIDGYEAKIAALERMVGRQALEIDFLKGALKPTAPPKSATMSVIAGPAPSASAKAAG